MKTEILVAFDMLVLIVTREFISAGFPEI